MAALLEEKDLLMGRLAGADVRLRVDTLNGVGPYKNDCDRGAKQRVTASTQQLLRTLQSLQAEVRRVGMLPLPLGALCAFGDVRRSTGDRM